VIRLSFSVKLCNGALFIGCPVQSLFFRLQAAGCRPLPLWFSVSPLYFDAGPNAWCFPMFTPVTLMRIGRACHLTSTFFRFRKPNAQLRFFIWCSTEHVLTDRWQTFFPSFEACVFFETFPIFLLLPKLASSGEPLSTFFVSLGV